MHGAAFGVWCDLLCCGVLCCAAETIEAVRGDVRQMEPHYTAGEIWVGKDADVGAQIAVQVRRGNCFAGCLNC